MWHQSAATVSVAARARSWLELYCTGAKGSERRTTAISVFFFRNREDPYSSLNLRPLVCLRFSMILRSFRSAWKYSTCASLYKYVQCNLSFTIIRPWQSRWPCGLEMQVCGRVIAGMAGSNPAEGMDVRLLGMLCR
jgi:hypothetical protein